ncbi:MAG TPA: HupE/UreJ family protein [Tahibacter sp.]|uniref:HupE/UreJ family protein n=1 Tax=Tahibacter sp. TaxID=2056211 RepID=UPI002B74F6DD|nr:HupE/UreJ family protein [Tahibacter sp.]HSX61238.1 HupE/UreJ family protein [Tahibacter sp.]
MLIRTVIVLLLVLAVAPARAHKPSDSYLSLRLDAGRLVGRWDIAVRDLDAVFDLDRNRDDRIDWGELRVRRDAIDTYATQRLAVDATAPCPLRVTGHAIDRHSDGAYLVLSLAGECGSGHADAVTIDYRALFDIDAQHRGLLKLETAQAPPLSAVFSHDAARQTFDAAGASRWRAFAGYVGDGVFHIAIGYDHLLFLVVLLLPAVLDRQRREWRPLPRAPAAIVAVLKIVTAFTLAHSVTLSLATLGLVQLPSRLTEALIALSVLLTALDNLVPFLPARRWIVAFAFGLVHGFGFASVLADLELPRSVLALSLVGFNLGVELGQLAVVALLMPLAWLLRQTVLYRPLVLRGGSLGILLLAAGWFVERSFDLKVMPF